MYLFLESIKGADRDHDELPIFLLTSRRCPITTEPHSCHVGMSLIRLLNSVVIEIMSLYVPFIR